MIDDELYTLTERERSMNMTEKEAINELATSVMGWHKKGNFWYADPHTDAIASVPMWNPFTYHADAHQLVERVGELGREEKVAYVDRLADNVLRLQDAWWTDLVDLYKIAQATPRQRALAVCRVFGIDVDDGKTDE
jgi:hypothetical protein